MRVLLLFLCLIGSWSVLQAQAGPPNAEPGKCYARCFIPDKYETVTEMVKVADERIEEEYVEPEYATLQENVLIQEEQKQYIPMPAQYETVTRVEMVRPERRQRMVVPAEYETATERVLVKPATVEIEKVPYQTRTVKRQELLRPASVRMERRLSPNCASPNPEDCYTWIQVEVPAEYTTVTEEVTVGCPDGYEERRGECVREVVVPAEYAFREVQRKVSREEVVEIVEPAEYRTVAYSQVVEKPSYREIIEPSAYSTVTRKVLKKPAEKRKVVKPAEYEQVTRRVLVRKGGYSEWREVLCPDQQTPALLFQIYQSLRLAGFEPGAAGDRLSPQAARALADFQKDRGLPLGHLDFETLAALGVRI